jgi:hypothetical protein
MLHCKTPFYLQAHDGFRRHESFIKSSRKIPAREPRYHLQSGVTLMPRKPKEGDHEPPGGPKRREPFFVEILITPGLTDAVSVAAVLAVTLSDSVLHFVADKDVMALGNAIVTDTTFALLVFLLWAANRKLRAKAELARSQERTILQLRTELGQAREAVKTISRCYSDLAVKKAAYMMEMTTLLSSEPTTAPASQAK